MRKASGNWFLKQSSDSSSHWLQNNAQNLKIRRPSFGAKQVCVKATVFIKEGVYTKKPDCVRETVCIKNRVYMKTRVCLRETVYIKEGVYTKERGAKIF